MARCGCGSSCTCTVRGSGALSFVGTGDVGAPYIGSITTNPSSPLPVTASSSGISVAGVRTNSTQSITLVGDGSVASPITAVPRLDPTGLLSSGVNGLRVDLPGNAVVPHAGRLINVSGTYQIDVKFPLTVSATTVLTPATVNPNTAGTNQALSSGTCTITNPSTTETMLVQVTYQSHSFTWHMAGVASILNSWNLVSSTPSQNIMSFTSTSAGIEYFAAGNISVASGGVVSLAPSASYTATFTQYFLAGTTSGSVSNAAAFGPGSINLVGWFK